MAVVDRIVFTGPMMQAFAKASHDVNPLHTDAVYAARTPFGYPVVYGVLGLLASLRNILRTMPIRITHLQADFIRPLHVGESYNVDVAAAGTNSFRISLLSADVVKQRIELRFEPWRAEPVSLIEEPTSVRSEAARPNVATMVGADIAVDYAPLASGMAELLASLEIPPTQLPPAQLAALLWSSYFIGMEVPGAQALYARLEGDFGTAPSTTTRLRGHVRVESVDRSSGFITLSANLTAAERSVANLRLDALKRPEPVRYAVDRLVSDGGQLQGFGGKRVLVTGASRGIGSLLALGAGAAGAHVFVHYRHNQVDAETVAANIREAGGKADVVGGDLKDPNFWPTLKKQLQRSGRGLDLFFHGAFTPILPRALSELSSDQVQHDFQANVLSVILGLQQLIPLLRVCKGRMALLSSVYVEQAPPEFSWYVAQKAALEGLLASVAKEHADLAFVALRLPKLVSDQTNVNLDPVPPADSISVALDVLRQFGETISPGFHITHTSESHS